MDTRRLGEALGVLAHAGTLYSLAASRQNSGDTARAQHLRTAADRLCDRGLQDLRTLLDETRRAAQAGLSTLPPVERGDDQGWPLTHGHKALSCVPVRP